MTRASALDRLEEFLAGLPAGFAYGTAERIQVRRLLLGLFAEGQLPEQLADLKTLLAPIVCINRDQQDSFYRLFHEEFSRAKADAPLDDEESRAEEEIQRKKRAFRRRTIAAFVVSGIIVGLIAIVTVRHFGRPSPTPTPIVDEGKQQQGPTDLKDLHPKPVTQITGRVSTRKGVLVEGADVWIPGKHTHTEADGTFSFDDAPDGKSVPVLVGDPRYRATPTKSTFQEPLKIQLAELAEKQLPAVGNMTAAATTLRLWSSADRLAAFGDIHDEFAVAGRSGLLDGNFGSFPSTRTLSQEPLQLAFEPNGTVLAIAYPTKPVEYLNLGYGPVYSPWTGSSIAYAPAGRILAIGTSGGSVHLFDQKSRDVLQSASLQEGIQALAFRPDGSSLVIATEHWVWDLSMKGTQQAAPLYPIEGGAQIAEMQFEPTGHYLMTRNRSGAVDVWDAYGQRVKTPADWPTEAIGSGFSNGELRIATAERWDVKFGFLPWVAALVPILAGAAWLYWLRRKRARLNRFSLPREMSTYSLQAPIVARPLQGAAVKKLGQEMRRRKPGLGQQLSIEASIHASARSAGFFAPVYRERTQQREFLILIEKVGRGDQQERFYRQLVEVLAGYTYVELYTFQSSPANVRDHIAGGWIDLKELAARYPEHDLWIVADPADFIDPTTLIVPEWMRGMLRWRDCALLSPYRVHESLRTLLTREGIPLGSASIHGMTELLTALDASTTTTLSDLPAYPRMLRRQPLQWVENVPPGDEAVADVFRILEDFLGAEGMLVLRACAFYPESFWKLTLWLANNLLQGSEGHSRRAAVLRRVTSLPWFRHGHIPDWMRARLLNGLGADDERVRNLVEEFLKGVQHGDPDLTIARRERGKPGKVWDYVMFSFLLGRKVDEKLAVKPPSLWMRMFFHDGRVVFGPRLWVHVAAALVLSVGVWFGTRAALDFAPSRIVITGWKLPEASQPPVARQFPSTPMRRAMVEVADSLVGHPPPADWTNAVAAQAWQFAYGTTALGTPLSTFAPAPGSLYKNGVIESVNGNQAVVIQAQNAQVRRMPAPLPPGPYLDYAGCVAGQTWERIPVGTQDTVATIAGTPSGDRVLAVGYAGTYPDYPGFILSSTDHGGHWTRQLSKTSYLLALFVTEDGRRAWAAGKKGTILFSTDAGSHWIKAQVPGWEEQFSGLFGTPDGKMLWAVGDKGAIFTSKNFGQTWSHSVSGTEENLSTITGTPDGKMLWVVGDNGTVLASKNFGESWAKQNPGTSEDIFGVFASEDAKLVVISSSVGSIFGTVDSGAHWARRRAPSKASISAITGTADGAWLWAFGDKGTILESTDAGATWKQQPSGGSAGLFRGFVTADAQTIWVGGEGGTLLRSDASRGCSQAAAKPTASK